MPFVKRLRRTTLAALLVVGIVSGAETSSAEPGGNSSRGGPTGVLGSAILLSADAEEITCFVSNIGKTAVAIDTVFVRTGGNLVLIPSVNTCSDPGADEFLLQPSANCVFSAGLDARRSARGVVEFRGSADGLRGQCQLTTSNNIIATTELR
jgi:hypothetical protein